MERADKHEEVGDFVFYLGPAPGEPCPDESKGRPDGRPSGSSSNVILRCAVVCMYSYFNIAIIS
jgi:hypothetical protein